MKKLSKLLFLFVIGGVLYVLLELLFRGRSHWTMGILGGLCFLAIGELNENLSWDMPLFWQALAGSAIITSLEFVTGVIVNLWLGWNVWNYSNMPLNILGQVCLPYSLLWILVSLLAIILDDYVRWKYLGEEKPHYVIF